MKNVCGDRTIVSASRLQDTVHFMCPATRQLLGAFRVRDGRADNAHAPMTRVAKPDPHHPFRVGVLVDGPDVLAPRPNGDRAFSREA